MLEAISIAALLGPISRNNDQLCQFIAQLKQCYPRVKLSKNSLLRKTLQINALVIHATADP